MIAAARAALLAQAEELYDPGLREGFLRRVEEHALILKLAGD